jgi:hypothetical protein
MGMKTFLIGAIIYIAGSLLASFSNNLRHDSGMVCHPGFQRF